MRQFLPITIVFIILGFFLYFAFVAFASEKILWCHCQPNGECQTLEIPEQALSGHVDASGNILHAGDHTGACEVPTLTPSIEPSVSPTATPSATLTPTDILTPTPISECQDCDTPTPTSTVTEEEWEEIRKVEGNNFGPAK